MRSPLALKLTGSPVVAGAENIRAYWRKGVWPRHERGPENPELELGRRDRAPLTVWWQLAEARASEFMDFDHAGRVVAQRGVLRKIAMRFRTLSCSSTTLWFGAAFIQFSIAQGNTLKILGAAGGARKSNRSDLVGHVAFLGGINLPIGLLSFYLLAARPAFFQAIEAQVALLLFFAACHFSQCL